MGNEPNGKDYYSTFPIEKYLNQGLNRDQVIGIRKIFDKLEPVSDKVKTDIMIKAFQHSPQKQYLKGQIKQRQYLSFQEFFEIFSKSMNQKKRTFKNNVTFESSGQSVECLLCPYAVDQHRD